MPGFGMTGRVSHACNGEAHHDAIGGRGGGSKLSLRSMDNVHPLLEGVGALTVPRDGPVGIPLALAATFAFRACELPSSAYHGPLVAPGLKLSALHHALACAGVGVVNLVTIFCRDHEHPMPRGRVSHGFVEIGRASCRERVY